MPSAEAVKVPLQKAMPPGPPAIAVGEFRKCHVLNALSTADGDGGAGGVGAGPELTPQLKIRKEMATNKKVPDFLSMWILLNKD